MSFPDAQAELMQELAAVESRLFDVFGAALADAADVPPAEAAPAAPAAVIATIAPPVFAADGSRTS